MRFFHKKIDGAFIRPLENQDGSVAIVIALLVLLAVTIMGVTSSTVSVGERFISGNDVRSKIAFFNSDAGLYTIPKVISECINERQTPALSSPPFSYVGPSTYADDITPGSQSFFREVSGQDPYDAAPDITFDNDGPPNNVTTSVDVRWLGASTAVGGGAEFGSTGEGFGAAMPLVRLSLTSTGIANNNTSSSLSARYRKVLGVASSTGGL